MCLLSSSEAILYRMIRPDASTSSTSSRLRVARAGFLALAACSLIASATVFVAARPAAEGQERASTPIKTGVSLVSVDFLAIGRDGRPVPDLKPDEVTLRVGGRARPVDSLNMIDVAAPAAPGPRAAISPLPAPYGSNIQSHDSRAFVLVVDDDSFRVGTERALREAADTFLDNLAADRSGRAGDDALRRDPRRSDHRTGESAGVARASHRPGGGERDPRRHGLPDPAHPRLARRLDAGPGWRLVAGDRRVLLGEPGRTQPAGGQVGKPRRDLRADARDVPAGWQRGRRRRHAALHHRAGRLREPGRRPGPSRRRDRRHPPAPRRTEENAFTRILRETSAFYRIAFEPEASQRNGASHRLELRVSRPDVTLRVRPNITIAKADPRAARSPADMLRQAAMFRDLPLRVSGFVSGKPDRPG